MKIKTVYYGFHRSRLYSSYIVQTGNYEGERIDYQK